MKWMEAIKLQAQAQRRDSLEEILRDELANIPNTPGLTAARLLKDLNVETELTLILEWESASVARHGSELARHLVCALGELGLVHRVTWLDVSTSRGPKAGLNETHGERQS